MGRSRHVARAIESTDLFESTDADMARVYDDPEIGQIPGASLFGHTIVEESQHLGQIAFIRGMQRGLNG